MASNKLKVLSDKQINEGYSKSLANAFRLLRASEALVDEYPEIALGLAEIGQEELGKSLSFLAAFTLQKSPKDWEWFWNAWRRHKMKAHRAFLYELFHPRRIELQGPGNVRFAGFPMRDEIQYEKEAAFYVDVKSESGEIISPKDNVNNDEVWNRIFTLSNLVVTAFQIEETIRMKDEKFRIKHISALAFRFCTENIFQQDVPGILDEFGKISPQHKSLIQDFRLKMKDGDNFFKSK